MWRGCLHSTAQHIHEVKRDVKQPRWLQPWATAVGGVGWTRSMIMVLCACGCVCVLVRVRVRTLWCRGTRASSSIAACCSPCSGLRHGLFLFTGYAAGSWLAAALRSLLFPLRFTVLHLYFPRPPCRRQAALPSLASSPLCFGGRDASSSHQTKAVLGSGTARLLCPRQAWPLSAQGGTNGARRAAVCVCIIPVAPARCAAAGDHGAAMQCSATDRWWS